MKNILYQYIKYVFIIFVFCIMFFPLRINSAENCPDYKTSSAPKFNPTFNFEGNNIIHVQDDTFGELPGSDLTGGYYYVDTEECTDCNLMDHREVIAPEVIKLEYKFDNEAYGARGDILQNVDWTYRSGGFSGCGGEGTEGTFYDMNRYRFYFDINVPDEFLNDPTHTPHTLYIQSTIRYDHPAGSTFDAYTIYETVEREFSFGNVYCEMFANPNPTGAPGDTTTLGWQSYNTDMIELGGCDPDWRSDFVVPLNSSDLPDEYLWRLDVNPLVPTRYSLDCGGSGIRFSCSVDVGVTSCDSTCQSLGPGWYDAPFWGGCDDCTTNPVDWNNACPPCGEAYAYCNGCNWDTNWSNHKCAGSAKTCNPGDKKCDPPNIGTGSDLYTCSDTGCYWDFTQDCGYHYWDDQYQCDATNRYVQRLYSENYCRDNQPPACLSGEYWINIEDCDTYDGWYGSELRDYSCSAGDCTYNAAPNVPVLVAPPHNVWINYDPTFQATVSDSNNDQVRAYFEMSASNYGGWVSSGGTSSYGPINLGSCYQQWWRAYAQDEHGLWSLPSGYWLNNIDKVAPPTPTISYPTPTVETTSFTVTLTESDACSGIAEGDVNIKIKSPSGGWGSWQHYSSTINDFVYTGIDKYQYRFQYLVKDSAGNWSSPVEGGNVLIDLNDPPTGTNLNVTSSDQCMVAPYYSFSWTYSDPDEDRESGFVFQVDNNSAFSSPEINRTISVDYPSPSSNNQTAILATVPTAGYLSFNTTYYWRIMVTDAHGLSSAWIGGSSFATPIRHCPIADFTNIPTRPNINEDVQFTDASKCFNSDPQYGNVCPSFSWTFTGGTPPTSALQNPVVKFTTVGNHNVTLQVSDGSCSCSKNKILNANYPPPVWKEIIPF